MDVHSEEAVTSLQCLLSTHDSLSSHDFLVSLCKSGSSLDVLLQASLKQDDTKKDETLFSEESLRQIDAILLNAIQRLEEEITNCVETSQHLDTELEVSVFGRLEQFLDFCAQRIRRNHLSVTALSCLSVIFDPNASFNKCDIWSSATSYPKGSQLTQLINQFGTCDGFESVRQCLRHAKDLSIAQLAALLSVFRIWYGHSDCKMRRKRQPPLDVAKDHVSQNKDQQDKFEVQEMEEKGRGVFTTVNISSGEFLVHYAGELISGAEGEERQLNSKSVYRYFFAWKGSSFRVDATPEPLVHSDTPKLGRLVNHGGPSEINAKMKVVEVEDKPALCLFAIKDIDTGQELLYDCGVQNLPWKQVRNGDCRKVPCSMHLEMKKSCQRKAQRPFGQCYRQLSADTIKRYFLPVSDAVCAHLLSCSDRQLFQQDVTPSELPSSLVGPRAAYVVVESVMNLLNVLKGDDVEAQSKVQYWQDTILTRLKHALEDEANSSDSSSSSTSKAPSQQSRRLSQDSNGSVASRASAASGSQEGSEKNNTNSRSCQTLPCVVNSVTHETLNLVDKLSRTIAEAATSDSSTTVTAKDNGNGTTDTGVMVAEEAVTLDMGSLPGATNQAEISPELHQPSTSYGNLMASDEAACRASAEVIPKEVIIWNPPVFETAAGSSKPIATMFDSSESSSMVSTAPSVPRSASELGNSCRVCFEGETSSKNRLIRPCRCSGSAASIHRQCLVKWIHISGHRRCEVCGARFSYIPMSERMRGFMDKFRNNRRWRNAAFAILVGLVVVLYLIIFAVFPRGIISQ